MQVAAQTGYPSSTLALPPICKKQFLPFAGKGDANNFAYVKERKAVQVPARPFPRLLPKQLRPDPRIVFWLQRVEARQVNLVGTVELREQSVLCLKICGRCLEGGVLRRDCT